MSTQWNVRVGLDRLDEGARRSACEIIELAGGTVASDGLPCDMWLTSDPDGPPSSVRASAQVPVIVIGPAGSLRLPGDEMMLADIVASCEPSPVFSPDLIRIGCAGWQGGVGVTAIARALAQQIRSHPLPVLPQAPPPPVIVVDTAEYGPGVGAAQDVAADGIHWGDLRADETGWTGTLIDALPVRDGVKILAADCRGGPARSDTRLVRVLTSVSSRAHVVVDLGRWDEYAMRTTSQCGMDALCLVGRADLDGVCTLMAGISRYAPPAVPVVIATTHGTTTHLLGSIRECGFQSIQAIQCPFRGGMPRGFAVKRMYAALRSGMERAR